MAASLTHDDVLQLVNNHDCDAKILVTNKITHNYIARQYAPDEIQIAEDIFRLLARDAELKVRVNLSESLKNCDDIPHDIALQLAKDVEQVAIPMLEFSNVLTAEDLCNIINNSEVQKVLAISRRRNIQPAVREAILKSDKPEAVQQFFDNDNFVTDENDYIDMIDKFADNEAIVRKIIGRASLPPVLVEKMMSEVSDNIVKEIKVRYQTIPSKFEVHASHSLEISILSVIDHSSKTTEIDYLVNHLHNFGKLTPSIVLSALCMGRKRFFTIALAKRAGIPVHNAEIVLRDGGQKGISLLLAKAGIPEKLTEAVDLVLRLTDEKKAEDKAIGVRDFCKWLISRLEYYSDKHQIEYLSYMMAIAKQSQKYRIYEA